MADPDATRVPSLWDRTLDTPEFHQYLDHLPLKQLCGICNGAIAKGDICVGREFLDIGPSSVGDASY